MQTPLNALDRRRFMSRSMAGVGLVAGLSCEEQSLLAWAERPPGSAESPAAVQGLPCGTIGKRTISRLICGGNLFSGFAHSRDLIYVSSVMKHYFTPEKIMDTLQGCEENGINTALLRCDAHIIGVLDRYRKERGGKIQWIAQTYPTVEKPTENMQQAVDHGAIGAFMQGGIGDQFVAEGRMDLMGKLISFMQQNGLIAGVGSHSLETPQAVVREKLQPNFYFKTFNNVDYNSQKPEDIAAFMKTVDTPWIAFKVLGAGVIRPQEGFRLALSHGADFLNVGMFDFQVSENARLVKDLASGKLSRQRRWVS